MKLELIQADITQLKVDAIVNAANSGLTDGSGVNGAIHRKGGYTISEECATIRKQQGGCPVGEAVITSAGNLPARYVIHTVGPRWSDGQSKEPELLGNCYLNSLQLAKQHEIKTIAFPNISTGIFGYPKQEAAKVAVEAVKSVTNDPGETLTFVCFDEENYRIYEKLLGG